MANVRKKVALVAIPGALTLIGAVGVAAASPSHSPAKQSSGAAQEAPGQPATDSGGNQQEPSYTGSIKIAQDQPGVSEADEAKALQGQAKISADQARQAAVGRYPGAAVKKVGLESENGSLVYSVELSSGGKPYDVKIDAGDGKVLHVETGGADIEAQGAESAGG